MEEDGSSASGGMLRIQGPGTLDFLNNKLSQSFGSDDSINTFRVALLLDAKGRVVDVLHVAVIQSDLAYLLTSPGYSSQALLERLEPFVFPMDQINLTHIQGGTSCFGFCLASTQYRHVQRVLKTQSKLSIQSSSSGMIFPGARQCVVWEAIINDHGDSERINVLVLPTTGLPSVACVGYTLMFFGSASSNKAGAVDIGRNVWERLIGEDNLEGPIEVGPLEYISLRIEAGQPSCGYEFGPTKRMTSTSGDDTRTKDDKNDEASSSFLKTSPLELHWRNTYVDFEKGCYLGQEGIASVLKNPRGPPRTLYSVVFQDDFNIYETQSRGDGSDVENLTKAPQPGQKLYALGSNEELLVGTLTSVAEPGGTGGAETVGLALIKRPDSILKQMKDLELEIFRDEDGGEFDMNTPVSSGIVHPPPMDPLDGLEVIVENTFTVGRLKCVPSRRLRKGFNMFDNTVQVEAIPDKVTEIASAPPRATVVAPPTTVPLPMSKTGSSLSKDATLEELEVEMAKAAAEADAAAAEAKRKAEKMEMLKKRAEEAMAKRKQGN